MTKRPIFVTGAGGMLAAALRKRFAEPGAPRGPFVWLDRAGLDITDAAAVDRLFDAERPRAVINCAAMTDVDDCERRPERAMRVNADGAANVARAAGRVEALAVQISTDFVFSGRAEAPYREDDPAEPVNAYGRSKLAAEQATCKLASEHLVVRSAWLYGPGGESFVRTVCRRAAAGEPLRVVGDQVGCPTYTGDLAEALARLLAAEVRGTVHACGSGPTSWYDFARAIVERVAPGTAVERIASADLDRPAPRPAYSVLDCTRLFEATGYRLPGYADSLPVCLDELAAETGGGASG